MRGSAVKEVDFLFEYEGKNREFDSICLIGAYLESRGYTVGYVNTWNTLFHTPPEYQARVMMLSACHDDASYDYFCGHAHSYDKVVDMQWEQVRSNNVELHDEYTGWGYSGVALQTRHICWGEREKQSLIARYGFQPEFLGICGYTPLDFYRPEFQTLSENKQILFRRYRLDPLKKTLLFVSSFAEIGLPKSEQAVGNFGDEEEKNTERTISIESQEIILSWFIRLLQEYPEFQIIYRPHPAEADNPLLQKYAKEVSNFFVLTQESIRNWIINCDILYNWQSTSMVEMYTSGKSVYLLRPVRVPPILDISIFEEGKYHSVSSYEQFRASALSDGMNEFPIPVQDLLSYYDIQEKPTCQRVGDYLIETLQDDSYHSPPVSRTVFSVRSRLGRIRRKWKAIWVSSLYHNKTMPAALKKRLEEDDRHFAYYRQKIRQNNIPEKEIRLQLKEYRHLIENNI